MQPYQARDPRDTTLAARFANLKSRLLLQRLNETPEPETHASIIKQTDEAALLAWLSGYPLLSFPCIFEERAVAATEQARRQARRYWTSLQQPAPAGTTPQPLLPPLAPSRSSLTPGRYLMLIRQRHSKTYRPCLAPSALPAAA